MLVWDTFKGHLTDELESELRKRNIITAIIPGGCTSKIQPLDVCINKPFKGNFRASWMSYMQDSVSHLQNGERLKTPTKQQVVNWVVAANQHIGGNTAMIKKSFLVCGISNAFDGSQNHIIRCAKELPTMSVAYSSDMRSTDTSDKDPFESSDPEGDQNETNTSTEEAETSSFDEEAATGSSNEEAEASSFDEEAVTGGSDEEAETSSSDEEAETSSDSVSQNCDPEFESDLEVSSSPSEY